MTTKSPAELEYEAAKAARATGQTGPRGSYTADRLNRLILAHNRTVRASRHDFDTIGSRFGKHADRLGTVEHFTVQALRDVAALSAQMDVLIGMLETAGLIDRERLNDAADLLAVLRGQASLDLPEDGEEWTVRDGRVVVTASLPAIHDVEDHYTDGRDAPLGTCPGCSLGHVHQVGPFEAPDTDDQSVPPPCCRAHRDRLS